MSCNSIAQYIQGEPDEGRIQLPPRTAQHSHREGRREDRPQPPLLHGD